MIQIVAALSFISYVGCYVQRLFLSNFLSQTLVGQETILDHFVSLNRAVVFPRQVCTILVNGWIIAVVRPENCLWHRIASFEFLSCFWVGKIRPIFSFVIIHKPRSIIPHRLHNKHRLSCCKVTCTRHHMIHPQSVVCLLPKLLCLWKSFRPHHNVPQP